MIPEVEVETYWTSLNDDVTTIIKLYRAHATSEQFHSELKTDLGLERLPSGKFQTNELVLLLGMVAYNLLRMIGQESLRVADAPIRKQVSRRRVRSVMQDLVYLACPAGETRTVLDAILREALSMAHNMAAGISSIRTDI